MSAIEIPSPDPDRHGSQIALVSSRDLEIAPTEQLQRLCLLALIRYCKIIKSNIRLPFSANELISCVTRFAYLQHPLTVRVQMSAERGISGCLLFIWQKRAIDVKL